MAFNFWDFVFLAGLGLDKGLQSWACQYMKMLFGFSFPSLICPDTASDKPQMEPELQNPSQFFNWTQSKVLLLVDFCNSIE